MEPKLIFFLNTYTYGGIFAVSLLAGYLLPIPEAVALVVIGFFAFKAKFSFGLTLLLSILGVVVGDNILFWLSKQGSRHVDYFIKKLKKNKIVEYEEWVKNNLGKTIYFLRFFAGFRFLGPVLAGMLNCKWKKFVLHNAIACAVHTSVFVALGYYYKTNILLLIAEVEALKYILLFVSSSILGVLVHFSRTEK